MSSAGDPAAQFGARSGESSSEARRLAVEQMLTQAIRMVERSRPMPFSTSVMINGEEVLGILQKAFAALPEELRAARWMLKERDDMRLRTQREGEEIIASARARAEQMVQRSEVVKAADMRARRTVSDAEERARRTKLETEDWCDQRLATFEAMLNKTLSTVSTGRRRLQDTRLPRPAEPAQPTTVEDDVFDQDLRIGLSETGPERPVSAANKSGKHRLVVDCVRLQTGSVDRIQVRRQWVVDEASVHSAHVADGVVDLDLIVRAAGNSFVAAGRVRGVWAAECRRCLEEVRGPLDAVLREVFEWEPAEGETWPIDDQRIDLAPAVRELAMLALPLAPLCSTDCVGPVPDRFPTGPAAAGAAGRSDA